MAVYDPYYDDPYESPDYDDAEEWQEGQCDNCTGSTAAELEAAATGNTITPVCACAIGQGATADACVCGPGGGVSGE
jgi:hypothetical protein